jgi:hypothetical protein
MIMALCLIGFLLFIIYPFCRKGKRVFFWLTGTMLSIIPACAGIPSSRQLLFTSIGFFGLYGLLLKGIIKQNFNSKDSILRNKTGIPVKGNVSAFHRFSIRIVIPFLLICYFVISPCLIVMHYADYQQGKEYRAKAADFGDNPLLREKTIVVVKPPDTSAMVTGLVERAYTEEPVPEFVRFLSSGMQTLELYRINNKSLSVKPEGGYNRPPSPITDSVTGKISYFHDQLFARWIETLYYNPKNPWRKGDCIRLTGLLIKVEDITDDGRVLEALFEFEHPLESSMFIWLTWDPAISAYRQFPLIRIGEKIRM